MPGSRDFAAELRDECLNGEIFYSPKEANVVIEQWRKHYNTIRPLSSLNYRPPAPRISAPETLHLDRSAALDAVAVGNPAAMAGALSTYNVHNPFRHSAVAPDQTAFMRQTHVGSNQGRPR